MSNRRMSLLLATAMTAVVGVGAGFLLSGSEVEGPIEVGPSNVDVAAKAPAAAEQSAAGDVVRERHRSTSGAYSAPINTSLEFAVRAESKATIGKIGNDERQSVAFALRGELNVFILARRGDELVAGIKFQTLDVQASAGGAARDGAALREDLTQHGAAVRMRDDGSLLGYRFLTEFRHENRNWVRSLMSAFCAVIAADGADAWQTKEPDATGVAELAYTRDGVRIERRKTAYVAGEGSDRPMPEIDGAGSARTGAKLGWLAESTYRERLDLRLEEAGVVIANELSFDAKLIKAETIELVDPDAEWDWDAPWAPANGAEDNAAAVDLEADHYRQLLAGISPEQLTGEIRGLIKAGKLGSQEMFEAREKLVWLLRLRPEALGSLRFVLADAGLERDAAGVVLSAVGAVGDDAAQAFLREYAAAGAAPHMRMASLQSMFQLQAPNAETLAVTAKMVGDASTPEPLAGTGLLLLGALASTSNGVGSLAPLAELENIARSRGMIGDWLEALGNAGHEDGVASAERYFGSEDSALRAAAISALRKVDTPAANRRLLKALAAEKAPSVRARAIEVLGRRADAAAQAATAKALREDASTTVRRAALGALADRAQAGDRAAAALVGWAAQNDRSADLRKLATELMAK